MSEHAQTPIATLDQPADVPVPLTPDRVFSVLGVRITDVTRRRAVELLEELIRRCRDSAVAGDRTGCVYYVNAHTLNLAVADPQFRDVLNAADYVFADGTGVRWAARLQGIRVRENLCGTDLTPEFFHATAGRGYRYFLLGADRETIRRTADYSARTFAGWTQAGLHHGYLADPAESAEVVRQINQARPDLLLVGMGNPIQERWIHRHRHMLNVPACMAVGGLFDYWTENVSRAPKWLRRLGHEWIWRLGQQPCDKAKRYLLGNPLFLAHVLRRWWKDRT
ncbi:MAG: WecB/TagA/CpsF family glycosyltransferase [Candidatus Nealsonbacteria bacterium]|nr:WecB/TagA/CpsF family glycosyltransferase [Candidatus Nealsonbacteria bacterium]